MDMMLMIDTIARFMVAHMEAVMAASFAFLLVGFGMLIFDAVCVAQRERDRMMKLAVRAERIYAREIKHRHPSDEG